MGWSQSDIPDQSGRVAIVTGANSGIGFETARALAEKGARVVLACRDPKRGQEAERRLRAELPDSFVRFAPLDLGSLTSVEQFAKDFEAAEPKLDLLCNNAGVMMPPLGRTAEGFELQFGTNHLGHFALTGRLLGALRRGASPRIVSVSSTAHYWGKMNFDDLNAEQGYNAFRAYGQSKLANLLFVRELAHRLAARGEAILAAGAHPGSTRTNLQQHSKLLYGVVAVFSQEPKDGCLPTLYAATAPGVRSDDYYAPGRFFELIGPPKPGKRTPAAKNDADAKRLWEISERLTGVAYGI